MNCHRPTLLLLCVLCLSACRITIETPDTGSVDSVSGSHSCAPGQSCEITVSDTFFDEVFEALPEPGQMFIGWKKQPRALCGGLSAPCPLSSAGFADYPELMPILESNENFTLEPVFEVEGGFAFNSRYCEILIVTLLEGKIRAEIFGSGSFHDCPQALWDQIDAEAIAEEYGALRVIKNGPRFTIMDEATLPDGTLGQTTTGEVVTFGELQMRQYTTVILDPSAVTENGAYKTNRADRSNVWLFYAGRRVYELENPEGTRYIMQSYTRARDRNLQLGELATLDERLNLPPGWSFHTRLLENEIEVPTIDGVAEVLTDDFGNTYQRIP
jgi:hypothetical protein